MNFLLGTWHGEGTVRGVPVTSRTFATGFGESMLRVDVETSCGREIVHRERILFRDRDGRLEATTSPWRGDAQLFQATVDPAGRIVLTCGELRWTIESSGPNAFSERFGRIDAEGRVSEIVALSHVRA